MSCARDRVRLQQGVLPRFLPDAEVPTFPILPQQLQVLALLTAPDVPRYSAQRWLHDALHRAHLWKWSSGGWYVYWELVYSKAGVYMVLPTDRKWMDRSKRQICVTKQPPFRVP